LWIVEKFAMHLSFWFVVENFSMLQIGGVFD